MNKVKLTKDVYIDAPSIKEGYPIEKREWDKIKNMVNSISMPNNDDQSWIVALVGISFTSFLSLIGFYNTDKTSDIIIIINWIVFLVAVFLIFILKKLKKNENDELLKTKTNVIDEMNYIIEGFE